MPIKDLIGPGFVGTATIEFIVTRGMGSPHQLCSITLNQII